MSDQLNDLHQHLPRFRLPMMGGGGTYRAFEVGDDSMLPITKSTTIVGRYVQEWHTIADNTPCIIVSPQVGICFRRISVRGEIVKATADNPLHEPKMLLAYDLLEIWEAKAYISSTFPIVEPSLDHLESLVLDLQQKVKRMQDERVQP